MKLLAGLLSAFFVLFASSDDMRLDLNAPHMVFLPPQSSIDYRSAVTVRVTAELQGDPENPEEYYCLDEEWEWDDGTRPALHEVDCDPWEDSNRELKRRFSGSHSYRYPGNYTIWLRLKHGDDTVIAGKVKVRITGG